jgi:nucleoside-diphosphate-sugar epimerase
LISEDTPLDNPYWEYSRNKIASEERLLQAYREQAFPCTIVRPSLTYGDTQIPLPLVLNSWQSPYDHCLYPRLAERRSTVSRFITGATNMLMGQQLSTYAPSTHGNHWDTTLAAVRAGEQAGLKVQQRRC